MNHEEVSDSEGLHQTARHDARPSFNPVPKFNATVIEAFGCTLLKTHVFQWDTCNQMTSMIIPPPLNHVETMCVICRVADPSLYSSLFSCSFLPLFICLILSTAFISSLCLAKWASPLMSPTDLWLAFLFSSPSRGRLPAAVCPLAFYSFRLFLRSSLIHVMQRSRASVSDTLQP